MMDSGRVMYQDIRAAISQTKWYSWGGICHHGGEEHLGHRTYTWGARKSTMGPEAQQHGLGMPERAIMLPPSLGMVFKGWGDGGARTLSLPLPSDRGLVGVVQKKLLPLPLYKDKPPGWCSSQGEIPALPWGSGLSSHPLHMVVLIKLP